MESPSAAGQPCRADRGWAPARPQGLLQARRARPASPSPRFARSSPRATRRVRRSRPPCTQQPPLRARARAGGAGARPVSSPAPRPIRSPWLWPSHAHCRRTNGVDPEAQRARGRVVDVCPPRGGTASCAVARVAAVDLLIAGIAALGDDAASDRVLAGRARGLAAVLGPRRERAEIGLHVGQRREAGWPRRPSAPVAPLAPGSPFGPAGPCAPACPGSPCLPLGS